MISRYTLEELNQLCCHTAVEYLGIRFIELGELRLSAELEVDERCIQPFGLLHGGISAALAETVGSAAALCYSADKQIPIATDLNITHLRSVKKGQRVIATAIPLYLGKESQVWQIEQSDEQHNLCAISRLSIRLKGI